MGALLSLHLEVVHAADVDTGPVCAGGLMLKATSMRTAFSEVRQKTVCKDYGVVHLTLPQQHTLVNTSRAAKAHMESIPHRWP